MPSFSRTKTAPTGYEKVRLLFHGIRTAQLVSSMVVSGIVSYFLYWLNHDNYKAPWTLIFLTSASSFTVLCLTVTIIFHFLTGLNPRFNLALNTFMLGLWALSFSLLSYWAWGTLTHFCDVSLWQGEEGANVCRCYKALFAFTLLGLLSTGAAFGLDIHIHRLATRFGQHMRLENMDQKPRVVDARKEFYGDNNNHAARSTEDLENYPSRNSDAFEVPHAGFGAHANGQNRQLLGDDGYAHNDGDFDFDTGYKGGHEERVFGLAK